MSDWERVRKFEYRQYRVRSGVSVDFIVGGETLHGVCRDVSDTGIRAEFNGSAVLGSSGLLILHKPTGVIKLEAYVAYIEKRQVGLSFSFKTPSRHGTIIKFVVSTAIDSTNEEGG